MRIFDYSHISDDLRDNDVCNLISAIREYRGKQMLFIAAKPDVLKTSGDCQNTVDVRIE